MLGRELRQINNRNPRVRGGFSAGPKEYPFMVSLVYYRKHECGATIISKDIILTAAHCVQARWIEKMQIRAGTERSDCGGRLYNVTKISYPSDYEHLYTGDIAIVRVEPSIEFTENIDSVSLFQADEEVGHKTKGLTAGWGLTEFPSNLAIQKPSPNLQQLNTTAYSSDYCYEKYDVRQPRTFCSWAPRDATACPGDSGGPFLIQQDSIWRQAGVYSSSKCADNLSAPMVWTKVSDYRRWIEKESASLLDPNRLPYARQPCKFQLLLIVYNGFEGWINYERILPKLFDGGLEDFSPGKERDFMENKGDMLSLRFTPWVVAIQSLTTNEVECSGAIINSWNVLTTASCVNEDGLYFVYTASLYGSTDYVAYKVDLVIRHENYRGTDSAPINDIAILRIDRPFEFNEAVSQIDMAEIDEPIIKNWPGQVYFVEDVTFDEGGYFDFNVYSIPLTMRLHEECNGIYEQSREGHVYENQICGVNNVGMCMKLRGASLVTEKQSKKRLIGLFSWKKSCEDPQFPSIFTAVGPYRGWIQSNMREYSRP
ncbi:hypothetical protein QAD02_011253 [Eretmocerus hayati]|uniref:Uncharacterized protein n=1 Tax=Eretmocerus hayati TaxID=131215 RepID=A0ACC2NWJ2_9HYME|nr:hypothetical protein QAD02_011253 [Eretmocerus hayati]